MSVEVYNEWVDIKSDMEHIQGYFQAIATILEKRKGRLERGWALTPILEQLEKECKGLFKYAQLMLKRRPDSEKHQTVVDGLLLLVVLAKQIEHTGGASLNRREFRDQLVEIGERMANKIEEILQSTLYD